MDPAGNGIVTWNRAGSCAVRYDTASGWGNTPVSIGPSVPSDIAVNVSGEAIVVGKHSYGQITAMDNMWVNRYSPGSGWGTHVVFSSSWSVTNHPDVAMDSSGNAIIVFPYHVSGGFTVLRAIRYQSGIGWSPQYLLSSTYIGGLDLAGDSNGNAIVVWGSGDVRARRFNPGQGWPQGWAPLDIIGSPSASGAEKRISMNSSGASVAMWARGISGSLCQYDTNIYNPSSGWGTATAISTATSVGADSSDIAMDPAGNAIAVWRSPTENRIYSARYE